MMSLRPQPHHPRIVPFQIASHPKNISNFIINRLEFSLPQYLLSHASLVLGIKRFQMCQYLLSLYRPEFHIFNFINWFDVRQV